MRPLSTMCLAVCSVSCLPWACIVAFSLCGTGLKGRLSWSLANPPLLRSIMHENIAELRRISPFLVTRILANSPAGAVSMRHQLKGPSRAAATACAAGADAIGEAFHLIRGGHADVMAAGGTEACVDAVALAAFGRRAPGGSPELLISQSQNSVCHHHCSAVELCQTDTKSHKSDTTDHL